MTGSPVALRSGVLLGESLGFVDPLITGAVVGQYTGGMTSNEQCGDIGSVSGAASVLTMRFSMPDSNSTALPSIPAEGSWTPLRKLGFRFLVTIGGSVLVVFVYGGFVVLNALIMPLKTGLAQVGSVLLRGRGVAMDATNSGDTLGDWYALAGCFFVAIVATVA